MRSLKALILLATVAASAAGCSSKDSSTASGSSETASGWKTVPAVSGTRLRARFITGGGSRELVGFHDADRNEDCTFQKAEDGRMRCLPAFITSGETGSFSDAACQIPLGSVSGLAPACGTADLKYAITYRYDGGSCGQSVAEIRRVLPGAISTRYGTSPGGPGGCTLQSGSPPSGAFVALGEVIPWTAFVTAAETIAPGALVAEKVLVATDGARQHVGFRIEKLDVDCTFQLMPDGVTRCLPEASAGPVIYTDSACTKATFVNDYQSTGGPCAKAAPSNKLWLESSAGTCAGTRAVYSLRDSTGGDLAPYDSSELYAPTVSSSSSGVGSSSVTCASLGSGSGSSNGRRAIDADVTLSLPTTARVSSGSGRLVPALVSNPATQALVVGWHDNERDADCTFTRASDGKLRCLPTGAAATVFHTDSACKSPSLVAVLGEVPCAGAARFGRATSTTCPVTTRVYALGTEKRDLTSASVETAPGHCPALRGVNKAIDATEVDPAGFVEGVPAAD